MDDMCMAVVAVVRESVQAWVVADRFVTRFGVYNGIARMHAFNLANDGDIRMTCH